MTIPKFLGKMATIKAAFNSLLPTRKTTTKDLTLKREVFHGLHPCYYWS